MSNKSWTKKDGAPYECDSNASYFRLIYTIADIRQTVTRMLLKVLDKMMGKLVVMRCLVCATSRRGNRVAGALIIKTGRTPHKLQLGGSGC